MKVFQQREIAEAIAYAAADGQALHVMSGEFAHLQKRTPQVFKNRSVIAHLFDRDGDRLTKTAKKLGVRVILIERPATDRQHVDLCGAPLDRALRQAATDAAQPALL